MRHHALWGRSPCETSRTVAIIARDRLPSEHRALGHSTCDTFASLALTERCLFEANREFYGACPGASVVDEDGALVYCTGWPILDFNRATIAAPTAGASELVGRLYRHLSDKGAPFCIQVSAALTPDYAAATTALGMHEHGGFTLMIANVLPTPVPLPAL